ncbi:MULTISPECIES: DUF2975 domain-containing protein [unclassified Lysinibacillus]|uniref:DUF2975 domain-containing protein n=1 Tax=unclassified Lysinibacillus TaxID=2636778 RepID=UPI002557A506|nr:MULTISPECIES: DUF2975 domain-containing protein [unclassified Lysinibacillus]MDM5247688.1 DUF2975 domain-containing protein [Lysinibacillus sp. G4S2]
MEQTLQSKEFRFLTKGLRTVFTIIMVLMIFGLTMIGVFLVGAIFVPENQVNNFLTQGYLTASAHLGGMEIELADKVAKDIQYTKMNFVKLLFTATIYIGILLFIVVQVRNLLSNLSKGIIFSGTNSRKMEWIAYAVVVLSLTVDSFQTYIAYIVIEQFNLDELLVGTGLIKGLTFHFTGINWTLLLCGLAIWTIARVVRYGAFLQDEYDATA